MACCRESKVEGPKPPAVEGPKAEGPKGLIAEGPKRPAVKGPKGHRVQRAYCRRSKGPKGQQGVL